MLKKIQHLSEGNFYGLHVTNKAKSLTLDKELRNIDSCKQAQSHIYRKEKRDLLGTLEKLYRKKDNHHFHEFQGELLSQERRSLPHESLASDQLNLKKVFLKNLKTSKPLADSVVERPATHCSTRSTRKGDSSFSPLVKGKQDVGTLIHRTTGYTNCCVICNLPLRDHGGGHSSKAACNCHHDVQAQALDSEDNYHRLGAHVHAHIHRPEDDFFQPDEAFQTSNMQGRHESLAKGKSYDHGTNGKLRTRNEEGKTTRTLKLDKKESDAKYYGERSRGSSFEEELLMFRKQPRQVTDAHPGETSRRGSLEEQRSWLLNRYRDKSRKNSLEYSDIIYLDSNPSSRRGSIEESSRYQALRNAYDKYSEMLRRRDNNDSALSARVQHHSNLAYKNVEDDGEAFTGLLHPDNIINHHHFLPYEAIKSKKTSQHRKHSYLDNRSHDYQNYGNEHFERTRTGSFGRERRGSFGHMAALFDRAHENDASNANHSRDMLMKLRQLLQVYHEMESEQNRYPWPRPSVPEFTTEDYEKLKLCRYLRIPRSHQNLSLMDRDSFDYHVA